MAPTFASTPPKAGSRTRTSGATRPWRSPSSTRIIRIATCSSGAGSPTSPRPGPTRTSTRWPRSTWARTSTRTVGRARSASSTRSRPSACRPWGESLGPLRAAMIALERISKGYGGQSLLTGCGWRIGGGERIGLVGPNGAGKTTLCRILAGVEEPDAGRVHRDSGVTVGYLPQEVGVTEAGTVLAEALSGFAEVWRLEAELERLAELMAGADAGPELTERYGDV